MIFREVRRITEAIWHGSWCVEESCDLRLWGRGKSRLEREEAVEGEDLEG